MSESRTQPSESGFWFGPRGSAACIVAGTVGMLGVMAVHPSPHSHDLTGFLREAVDGALLNRVVHGAAIASVWVAFAGLLGFAAAMGMRHALVRLGLVVLTVGFAAWTGAATVNGVVLPWLAERYVDTNPATVESCRPLLVLCTAANRACDHIGIVAVGTAFVLWSIVLMRSRATLGLAIAGLVCGLGPIAFLFAGRLSMTVHGFGAVVLAQSIWFIAAAVTLARGLIGPTRGDIL